MKNIAIIYHDADFDGKLSNEVCRHWLAKLHPDATIHSYGWDYGRPVPTCQLTHQLDNNPNEPVREAWHLYDTIYIVDLSVDELMGQPELRDKIVWIDHHRSAIDKYDHPDVNQIIGLVDHFQFAGYRIDGVAACRLCWEWFSGWEADKLIDLKLPNKDHFVNRLGHEPELIRLAGEYDVWDKRDPDAEILQLGLKSLSDKEYRTLIESQFSANDGAGYGSTPLVSALANGYAIKAYVDNDAAFRMQASHDIVFHGLHFLVLNGRGNSNTFKSHVKPRHDALMLWFYDGKQVKVSLYHASGHEEIDLSLIARQYGGGGHRGACGFTTNMGHMTRILNSCCASLSGE